MLKNKKGQSAVEFSLILPVIVLMILGAVQLLLIAMNLMLLQYSAYMTARTASMYEADEVKNEAGKICKVTKNMVAAAANYDGSIYNTAVSAGKDLLISSIFPLNDSDSVKIEERRITSADKPYRKIMIIYLMPLKVPVINRIFGMLSKEPKLIISSALSYPVIRLSASGFVRVE